MSAATKRQRDWVASLLNHRDLVVDQLARDYLRPVGRLRLADVERLGRQVGAVMVRAPLLTDNQWRLEALLRVLEAWLWGTGRKAA
jgi:hypothetical protein